MAENQGELAVAASNVQEFSVSELAGAIKRAIEDGFGFVRLRGEISGFRGPHSSGHCYFSLKDERARIDAVVWRGVYSKLKVKPEEGMEVIAQGKVTTYPNSSKYQIVIETLEPAGVGALMALLEERKKKLAAEGLFDEVRKRPLPFLPRTIGIVTSPTGAVIRDMLAGFTERFPTHVLVWPVRVQGETSAAEVAAAIRGFNALPAEGGPVRRPDVLIVARGGGSLEDLWSFNEEIVVRAAAASEIPLIAAIGHETDWTLVDLVADARAPTPTKAAEWAVPKYAELADQNDQLGLRLKHGARRRLEAARSAWLAASRGLPRLDDLVALPRQRLDGLDRRLGPALLANARAHAMRLTRTGARLVPNLLTNRLDRAREALERRTMRKRDALRQAAALRRRTLTRIEAGLRPRSVGQLAARGRERLGVATGRLSRSFQQIVRERRSRFAALNQLLASLGYQSVLKRGFAIVRGDDGRAMRSVSEASAGMQVSVELHDGRLAAHIDGDQADAPGPAKARAKPAAPRSRPTARSRAADRDKQGSLF